MSEDFYRAFEDRHRGSREVIKSRLGVYIPFVQLLLTEDCQAKAVDLGCGRGEWVELIAGLGFDAIGVDLDQGMLDAGHELGLKVEKGDALSFISALPDESQSIVSAFHIVEHVTFEQLQVLISEALRVLKPGGLLIMETPNPENIVVATRNFYIDPTHVRPIPPALLLFLAEYHGYSRSSLLRLQESDRVRQAGEIYEISLIDVFEGVSQDYAVVAQKEAGRLIMEPFDNLFQKIIGVDLNVIATRFDQQMKLAINKAQSLALTANSHALESQAMIANLNEIMHRLELRLAIHETALMEIESSRYWRMRRKIISVGSRALKLFKRNKGEYK